MMRGVLRAMGFEEQQETLTHGLEGNKGGAGAKAEPEDPCERIVMRTGMGRAPAGDKEWALLAGRVQEDGGAFARKYPLGLSRCLRFAKVSWENATADQQTVFMALGDRESLRKELLKNSALFGAISKMHMPVGAGDQASRHAKRIQDKRLRENGEKPGEEENWYHDDSVAKQIMTGAIAYPALVEPVKQGRPVKNARLAAWVKKTPNEMVEKRLHELACGIANLFAMAMSRGEVKGGAVPSFEDAAEWLFGWSLGHSAGLLDSDGVSCTYNPTRVVAALSGAKRAARVGAGQAAMPVGGEDSYALLGGVVESRLKGARLAAEEQSRLALVQGSNKTHTFFLYKDMDRVWRPMDAYLNLEDLGGEQAGGFKYSEKISTLYFAVDKR